MASDGCPFAACRTLSPPLVTAGAGERPGILAYRVGAADSAPGDTEFVPVLFSCARATIMDLMPFEIPHRELSDAEIAAVLRDTIAGAGRFPRHIELWFAAISAEHLVDGLRLAGLVVIQPMPTRLTD